MEVQSIEEELKSHLDYIRKNNITAYEIRKKTGACQSSMVKLIKGKTKKPQRKTILLLRAFVKEDKGIMAVI